MIPTAPSSTSYLKHDVLATSTDALILDYNHNGKADAILTTGGTYTASNTLPDTTPISDYLYYATTTPPKRAAPNKPPRLSPR